MTVEPASIPDKIEVVRVMADQRDYPRLSEFLVPINQNDSYQKKEEAASTRKKIAFNLEKWCQGTSPQAGKLFEFFDLVNTRFELQRGRNFLVSSNLADFVNCFYHLPKFEDSVAALPEHIRSMLEPSSIINSSASTEKPPARHTSAFARELHVFHVDVQRQQYDVKAAVKRCRVDQRFLYVDRKAAQSWKTLTLATHRYPTYRYCTQTLDQFTGSEFWHSLIREGKIASVFMLGAGSPAKDLIILDSLDANLADECVVNYVIVDTSINMIITTLRDLEESGHKYARFLNLITISADFNNMPSVENYLDQQTQVSIRPSNRNVAYFFPGGTISNIDEREFIESLSAVARANDILVVGVEFIPEGDVSEYEAKLKKRYDHPDLKNFFIPIVRSVLDDYHVDDKNNQQIDGMIEVDTEEVNGGYGHLGRVVRVIITADICGKKVLMQVANRYDQKEFIEFFQAYGFALKELIPHSRDPQYNQAVFIKQSSKSSQRSRSSVS